MLFTPDTQLFTGIPATQKVGDQTVPVIGGLECAEVVNTYTDDAVKVMCGVHCVLCTGMVLRERKRYKVPKEGREAQAYYATDLSGKTIKPSCYIPLVNGIPSIPAIRPSPTGLVKRGDT